MKNNNLVNLATRTQRKRKEIATKGGLASGKVRLAKSYNIDLLEELKLNYDKEQIENNNYFFYLNDEGKEALLEIKEKELKKIRERAEKKKESYRLKYNSDIDEDLDKIIKHLNRKYDKEERRLSDERQDKTEINKFITCNKREIEGL